MLADNSFILCEIPSEIAEPSAHTLPIPNVDFPYRIFCARYKNIFNCNPIQDFYFAKSNA